MENLYLDGVMGVVVGDALGVPVEFTDRNNLIENPVTDMRGYGTYDQPQGTWSDDSSMTITTLDSLRYGYDLRDLAQHFLLWKKKGEYTPYGKVFDIGIGTSMAISNFEEDQNPRTCGLRGEYDNGNGSLMRILPICIYAYSKNASEELAMQMVHDASALTHAHARSKMACGLYYFCTKMICEGKYVKTLAECLHEGLEEGLRFYKQQREFQSELKYFKRLENLDQFQALPEEEIRSSGYVIDSIEATLWCLLNTDSYEQCVLKAVNLGGDTDTTAAIAGGLAGLYYGYDLIPEKWKQVIARREWIEKICKLEI